MIVKYRAYLLAIISVKISIILIWHVSRNGLTMTPFSTNISNSTQTSESTGISSSNHPLDSKLHIESPRTKSTQTSVSTSISSSNHASDSKFQVQERRFLPKATRSNSTQRLVSTSFSSSNHAPDSKFQVQERRFLPKVTRSNSTSVSTGISSSNHALDSKFHMQGRSFLPESTRSYFVYTKGCVIPRRDAFDAVALKYYSKPRGMTSCHENIQLTSQDGTMLYLDNRTISYCEYQNIYQKPNIDSEYLLKDTHKFTESVNISSKYIHVTCYDTDGNKDYTHFHHFIQRNESRLLELDRKLKRHIIENKPVEVMNVMMVMMDSVSRLNHIRHMPKTRQFLLKNMSAIDFEGYNRVGENTFPNVVPILTGNYVSEESKITNTSSNGPFDNYNLIWKHFSSNGYTTMFSEDCPHIGTFSYLMNGFRKQPCDHSIRPLALAMDLHWRAGAECHGNRSETEFFLDSTYNFVNTYRDKPYFSLTTITRLTHDYLNKLAKADDYYLDFFTQLHKNNLLNNTVAVFLSDHGHRISTFVFTELGQFEARMPMMYFVFPVWFNPLVPKF